MERIFPIGFPWPTAMYLTLFVVTSTIYMLFMQYVLAGSMVLVVGSIAPGARWRLGARPTGLARSGLGLIVTILRDWMAAILGLAITAGIAPLLFLQILYKRQFYTANLLLSHRFMLLLPALIVAYYMLYLIKSRPMAGRSPVLRGLATSLAFACFFYTAWAWTENHVLSLHKEVWPSQYESGRWLYRDAEIWPRLGFWLTASFATLAAALAWQLHWGRHLHDEGDLDRATRRLRALAIMGLATSAAEGWLWQLFLEPSARDIVMGLVGLPYAVAALAGMAMQALAWLPVRVADDLTPRRLTLISTGTVLMILGALVVREARRLASIDVASLYDAHRRAAQVGGMGVFLVFLVVNAGVIATCILMVRRALRPVR